MLDKLKEEVIRFLEKYAIGHIALSGPDGPWSCVVRYISDNLRIYLIEMRAGDLAYLIKDNPDVVFTVTEPDARMTGWPHISVQLVGKAHELSTDELSSVPGTVQAALADKEHRQPNVYGVVMVIPVQVHCIRHNNGRHYQQTLEI